MNWNTSDVERSHKVRWLSLLICRNLDRCRGKSVFSINPKDQIEADCHQKITENDKWCRHLRPPESITECRDHQKKEKAQRCDDHDYSLGGALLGERAAAEPS